MITAIAQVTRYHQHANGDKYLYVRCQQQTSCGSCAAKDHCGTGVVSRAISNQSFDVKVAVEREYEVGALVEIGIEEQVMLRSALWVYGLPILFALVSALLMNLLTKYEPVVIAASFLSGFLGFLLARYFSARSEQSHQFSPKFLRAISSASPHGLTK